jgi:deoxyguanosine kinase
LEFVKGIEHEPAKSQPHRDYFGKRFAPYKERLRTSLFAGMLNPVFHSCHNLFPFSLYLPMYIAIEGVIGVGKTTLARLLQPAFQATLLLEIFEENPFLSSFYTDRQRYAFQTQIFFLLSRYHQQRRAVPDVLARGENLIADYTFQKDALFARINLQGDELDMYYRVHEALAEKIPSPDLIVYLRADTNTLMQRINLRDRPYERSMERAYIEELNRSYEDYFAGSHTSNPALAVDSDNLDYIRHPEDLKWIENRIRQALRLTPFQPELPLIVRE